MPNVSGISNELQSYVKNEKATLKKDDFLKLFLTQLKYQDPTKPMDTAEILSQTSELSSLEATENTKDTLNQLNKTMKILLENSNLDYIGKNIELFNKEGIFKIESIKIENGLNLFKLEGTEGYIEKEDISKIF